MPAVVNGVVAHVKWAYYTAAIINGYTVTRTAGEWGVRASIVQSDAFKMAQRPLVFIAPHKHKDVKGREVERAWRWPILSHEIKQGTLIARLGPPEQ